MRLIAFLVLVTMGVVTMGVTMGVVSQAVAEERVNVLPEVVIGSKPNAGRGTNTESGTGAHPGPSASGGPGADGATRAPAAADGCVGVETGSSKAMDCLNQKLKQQVDRVNPTVNLPPIDARSSDLKTGVVNIPGVQQQYGKNFGVSAVPYRPAPPVFSSPVGPRH